MGNPEPLERNGLSENAVTRDPNVSMSTTAKMPDEGISVLDDLARFAGRSHLRKVYRFET